MIAGGNHTIIQQDGFLRGSAEFRTSPMPISLVTFLFGDKKVTEGVRQIPVYGKETAAGGCRRHKKEERKRYFPSARNSAGSMLSFLQLTLKWT